MSKHLHGTDIFGKPLDLKRTGRLSNEFLIPPFSVLMSRQDWWQKRKRAWLSYGIESDIGRAAGSFSMNALTDPYRPGSVATSLKRQHRAKGRAASAKAFGGAAEWQHQAKGRSKSLLKFSEAASADIGLGNTSIFDPVLCELLYRWFCPIGGQVVDPFAGGSVRGLVAGLLGRDYWGCDLSADQIAANREQAAALRAGLSAEVVWNVGDSALKLADAPEADFIMSCPPYGDLERYSEDPADLSTMQYKEFRVKMAGIVARCVALLRQDRFACFVVANFRDKQTGFYNNFAGDTIRMFERAGAYFYNDAILVNSIGSLPIRTAKQFRSTRKLGKLHQNVLIFCKGGPRAAATACFEGTK